MMLGWERIGRGTLGERTEDENQWIVLYDDKMMMM